MGFPPTRLNWFDPDVTASLPESQAGHLPPGPQHPPGLGMGSVLLFPDNEEYTHSLLILPPSSWYNLIYLYYQPLSLVPLLWYHKLSPFQKREVIPLKLGYIPHTSSLGINTHGFLYRSPYRGLLAFMVLSVTIP